jgi:hypothetical protein
MFCGEIEWFACKDRHDLGKDERFAGQFGQWPMVIRTPVKSLAIHLPNANKTARMAQNDSAISNRLKFGMFGPALTPVFAVQ